MSNKVVDNIRVGLLKKFGSNAIIMGADHQKAQYGRISTGSIDLDLKLGGGIPIGRISQISGAKSTSKSTLCDYIVKNAQTTNIEWIWTERREVKGREQVEEHIKKVEGMICAYLDVEGTKTTEWTGDTIGVDTNNWLYSQPTGLEEALEMAHQMQKDGVNLIVIDSIDSLEPTKEYNSQMGESVQMGIKPKMMGEYCRKFTATNNLLSREGRLPCTVIMINQLREKIGCFEYNSKVSLADGSFESIGSIVENKKEVEVLSYNEITNRIEPKLVTGWFNNGEDDNFMTLKVRGFKTSNKIRCTTNHKILNSEGVYVRADSLKVGDKVKYKIPSLVVTPTLDQFITGSLLGDGCIRMEKKNSYGFRLCHGKCQDEYIEIKANFLDGKMYNHSSGGLSFESKREYIFKEYYDKWYVDGKNCRVPNDIKLTPLSLAIWYLDDGNLCDNKKLSIELSVHNFDEGGKNLLVEKLKSTFDIDSKVNNRGTAIFIGRANSQKLFDIIKDYIPSSLSYKFNSSTFTSSDTKLVEASKEPKGRWYSIFEAPIQEIKFEKKPRVKYDIEVEDNHNYIVNNILVHNSYGDSEYTPGGRAIEFYVSLDLRLRKGDWIVEGKGDSKEIVGQVIKFKSNKNKTYKQQQSGEFEFYFQDTNLFRAGEIDNFKEIVVNGMNYGVIERAGSWFKYQGENIAQGADNVVIYLREHPELFNQIKNELFAIVDREATGLTKGSED